LLSLTIPEIQDEIKVPLFGFHFHHTQMRFPVDLEKIVQKTQEPGIFYGASGTYEKTKNTGYRIRPCAPLVRIF
jgi:hypothetical protein